MIDRDHGESEEQAGKEGDESACAGNHRGTFVDVVSEIQQDAGRVAGVIWSIEQLFEE
ncbi:MULTISPECIES: hypothetical protein [unclassified Mesorhizobium]|uniref:hypothetical protein n=1 Tax=unclassified Mesorhizobium TaxID=325217 RepID=UPI001CCA49CA|nr:MULTISPECIES: hypothetical protein [unclassified Mesorhizobium]MBZ9738893.1 hypothetical protein [Mesorhizobium sp. CO1-1-4]MBZ9802804.1 hypothetical protein [Mesorhizobium sp. ES1-6]